VTDQDREAVEEHLQQAGQARLIRAEQAGTFTFSHDLILACLYDEMSASRRTRLHTLIGRRLELRLDPSDAHQLAGLAFHFARSGDRQLGATYSQLAAEQARCAYAPREAVRHYRTALLLVADHDQRRGEWLQGLGEVALLAASPQEAIGAFQAAQDWWLRVGNRDAAGRAALGLGRAHWRLEAIGPARAALQKAVTLLSALVCAETVQALIELGSLLVLSLHEHTEARGSLDQALTLAQRFGDVRLEATESCAGLFLAYSWAGSFDRRDELLQRWLAYARSCHDPYQLRHLYSHLAAHYAFRGQRAEAEEALTQGRLIVEQLASPEPAALLQLTQGLIAGLLRGDLETAEDLTRAAIARFRG
jgi:tetratricopeptide (TPR) repeat protein